MENVYTIKATENLILKQEQVCSVYNTPPEILHEYDLSDQAIYHPPEVINKPSNRPDSMDHTYIVVSGTLYLKFSDRTEVISEQQYLTLVHINEPVLLYGNKNCYVFYIGAITSREMLSHSAKTISQINNEIYRKDHYTAEHCKRVRRLVFKLALKLKLTPTEIYCLRLAALYHDLGKIDTPVEILLKEGPLTDAEMDVIRKHPSRGAELFSKTTILLSDSVSNVILQHHERLDGRGYPDGLAGDQISMAARILSISDAFDALTSDRPYRKALSNSRAIEILESDSGALDPTVLKALTEII